MLTKIAPETFRSPPPPAPWIVKGLVAKGCLTVLAGVGGLGKSSLALALAAATARGESHYAGFSIERQVPMVYIDGENGLDEMHRRAHLFDIFEGFYEFSGNLQDNVVQLAEILGQGPAFVVLDAFRVLYPHTHEDASEDVLPILLQLQLQARVSNCGILLLHHTDKAGFTYRGSGEFRNRPEVSLLMQEDGRGRYLRWLKVRMGEEHPRMYLRMDERYGKMVWEEAYESASFMAVE